MVEIAFPRFLENTMFSSTKLSTCFFQNKHHEQYFLKGLRKTCKFESNAELDMFELNGVKTEEILYVPYNLDYTNIQKYLEKELLAQIENLITEDSKMNQQFLDVNRQLLMLFDDISQQFDREAQYELLYDELQLGIQKLSKFMKVRSAFDGEVIHENIQDVKEHYIKTVINNREIKLIILEYPETAMSQEMLAHFLRFLRALEQQVIVISRHPESLVQSEEKKIWNDYGKLISLERLLITGEMFTNNIETLEKRVIMYLTGFLPEITGVEYELIDSLLYEKT